MAKTNDQAEKSDLTPVFGRSGRRFWDDLTETFDFTEEPHKLEILRSACRTLDVLDRIREELDEAPLQVKGSMGQPVANGLIAAELSAVARFESLVRSLKLPEDDDLSVVFLGGGRG